MLTQHMMRKPNTIYVIRYDYCLGGETIEVPEGCVLEFDGGTLRNGKVKGNNTYLKANHKIFSSIEFEGSFRGNWRLIWFYDGFFGSGALLSHLLDKGIFPLLIDDGIWEFDSVVQVEKGEYYPNITLIGSGRDSCILSFPNSMGLSFVGEDAYYYGVVIKDLTISSNGYCVSNINGDTNNNFYHCDFENLFLENIAKDCCIKFNYKTYANKFVNIQFRGKYGIEGSCTPKGIYERLSSRGNTDNPMTALLYNSSGTVRYINELYGEVSCEHFALYDEKLGDKSIMLFIEDSNFEDYPNSIVYSSNKSNKSYMWYSEKNTTFINWSAIKHRQLYFARLDSFESVNCNHITANGSVWNIEIEDIRNESQYGEEVYNGVSLNIDKPMTIAFHFWKWNQSHYNTFQPEDKNTLKYHKFNSNDKPDTLKQVDKGFLFYDSNLNRYYMWDGEKWRNQDNTLINKVIIV